MSRLFVIDATGYVYRSYFAIRGMSNPQGEATNALYGFVRSILKLINDFSPTHMVAVFDGPRGAAPRQKIYPDYKAHRLETPDDLPAQREWSEQFCQMLGVTTLTLPEVEADDVMGSIAKWGKEQGSEVYLCTSDKDLFQCIDPKVKVLQTHKDNLIIDAAKAKEKFGVRPEQMIDYLAIVGDSADNIPGLPGFGPKTAQAMLEQFDTLETLLKSADQLKGKKKETVENSPQLALMCKELVTIRTDVPIPESASDYQVTQPDEDKLREFYTYHGFKTLLNSLPKKEEEDKSPTSYELIDDQIGLKRLIEQLQKVSEICIDTETTGLNPTQEEMVGIAFSHTPGQAWYIPTNGSLGMETVVEAIKPLLLNPKVGFYGHNLKYDLHILANHGLHVKNILFDTILASYVLSGHSHRHSLDALSLEHFGKVKTPIEELIGKGKKQISMKEVPIEKVVSYACEDADYTVRLKEVLEKELKDRKLEKLYYDLELPLMDVLFKMERAGIFLDPKVLHKMGEEIHHKLGIIEKQIYEAAGEEFNIKSPKQVGDILFEKLGLPKPKKTATGGYSTSADILEGLSQTYPIVQLILDYRMYEKLRSTYIETLPDEVNPNTQRIHCTFNQSVAATGRLSARDPNLQNIPIRTEAGQMIRSAFRPEKKGWSFLSADYSQIELRLLAHLSQDPALVHAFEAGQDIHASTASKVLAKPLKEVSKEERRQAKAVNFGIIYGQQAFGLSKQLNISMKQAADFIKKYFDQFPKVKLFIESCKTKAHETGRAVTMHGRERMLPEINNRNAVVRGQAERLAVNTPLQGASADLIKVAMLKVQKELEKQNLLSYIVLQIHDELILEVPDHELLVVEHLVKEAMEKVMKLKVPLEVNIAIGKNWKEC